MVEVGALSGPVDRKSGNADTLSRLLGGNWKVIAHWHWERENRHGDKTSFELVF